MSFALTPSGIVLPTYQEVYDAIATAYRGIYGADINLDPESPDGVRVALEAKNRHDIMQQVTLWYNQHDPDFAVGEALNQILKYSGTFLRPATRSTIDVTVTVSATLTLPDGWTVKDQLGQKWRLSGAAIVTAPSGVVTLTAVDFGAIAALPGTVTTPINIVNGVTGVTNASAATVGIEEETAGEARVRRNRSLQLPALSSVGGLYSVLANTAGVTDVLIYENDTSVTDVVLGLSSHSIWAIVEGGTVADIVEVMAKNKNGGTGLKGATVGTYTETVTRPDGTQFNIAHEMRFDRPTITELHVRMHVLSKDGTPIDTAAIAAAIDAVEYYISETAVATELYDTVYGVASNFIALSLEISDDGAAWVGDKIEAAANEKYTIPLANVTITDITP